MSLGRVIRYGLAWVAWLGFCCGQTPAQVLVPDEEDEFPYRPGLVAEYRAGDRSVTRVDPVVAFDWEEGSCDLRLPGGPFQATWRGRLWTREMGSYRLLCYGQGRVRLHLAGKRLIEADLPVAGWAVSEAVELPFDFHPLKVEYERTVPAGRLALYWSGPGFSLEPVPARFLLHERSDSPPQQFERGRILAEALRCAACHREAGEVVLPAPALDLAVLPLTRSWLHAWLTAPVPPAKEATSGNVTRRMPHLPLSAHQAEAIASWLLVPRGPGDLVTSPDPAAPDAARAVPPTSSARTAKRSEKSSSSDRRPSLSSAQPPSAVQAAEPGKEKGSRRPAKLPTAEDGARLIETRGCLACHTWQGRGQSGWFGGGDLAQLAAKRPAGFLVRWLQDPSAINRHHRMPVFPFSPEELAALAQWEAALPRPANEASPTRSSPAASEETLRQGRHWATQFRCGACHALPEQTPWAQVAPLSAQSDWSRSCGGRPAKAGGRIDQPAYGLTDDDHAALRAYFSTPRPGAQAVPAAARGWELLLRNNCLACHLREEAPRQILTPLVPLAEQLAQWAPQRPELASLVAAMTPPALISVGDKLHVAALEQAILRRQPPHRDYLLVAMPRFPLQDEQVRDLVHYFLTCDRIPDNPPVGSGPASASSGQSLSTAVRHATASATSPHHESSFDVAALSAAGARLVTTDGLSCTSCHQVGSVIPDKAPLNARGPSLSMLGQRIRRAWFDRWCADPARIVPRMEMPSVKVPVRGVLDERIDTQLAAVWHVLNTPSFEPPQPNPVRVLRRSGIPEAGESAVILHDVVKDQNTTYLFPLVVGLPNRHNVLIDMATGVPAAWWLGDVARQRTKGKSWYWEPGAATYRLNHGPDIAWTLQLDGRTMRPELSGERIELDRLEWAESVQWQFALRYRPDEGSSKNIRVLVRQRWSPPADPAASGMDAQWELAGLPAGSVMHLRLIDPEPAMQCRWDAGDRVLHLPWPGDFSLRVVGPRQAEWDGAGGLRIAAEPAGTSSEGGSVVLRLEYRTRLVPDRFVVATVPLPPEKVQPLELAPGFAARRLALPVEIMPSGLAWDARGRLVFCTLKGEVYRAEDRDGDGCEETLTLLCDGLPTPYGIYVPAMADDASGEGPIDVLVKTGLYRLWPADAQAASGGSRDLSRGTLLVRVASGWGCTDDYHDWAVGLVPDGEGGYYVALPCQQDERSKLAARHRGQVLRLVPKRLDLRGTPGDQPDDVQYDLTVVSAGHRFPMGLALGERGALFVTDNQGNYNPFNELNHVRPGAHYGFINALEKKEGVLPPPLEPPAIDIPHPWTRSVNGICFLATPPALRAQGQTRLFGPLEGHLVGCEYDTRRLIRMTLDAVGDTFQGAAYPLSIPPEEVHAGLLGPIVCAVSPSGVLYVGEIRDSGWGAGNNIGQITQVRCDPAALPCGIAQVRATPTGFELEFFQPVEEQRASDPASYRIESYRRESTPAYGGPDLDRRQETISAIEVARDGRHVRLTLPHLREGYVYEFKLRNLSRDGKVFHPDEAHYTLRFLPR